MKGLGQCIPGVASLFHVQCYINGLGFASPLAVHLSAGQFFLQAVLVNSQEESRESQNCKKNQGCQIMTYTLNQCRIKEKKLVVSLVTNSSNKPHGACSLKKINRYLCLKNSSKLLKEMFRSLRTWILIKVNHLKVKQSSISVPSVLQTVLSHSFELCG